jgi:tetraacyldisaccharide 4'-kinase
VLLTGIASPQQLEGDFKQFCPFHPLRFGDHHSFVKKDMEQISQKLSEIGGENGIVVTTEKDAMRLIEYLRVNPNDDIEFIRNRYKKFYVLPVEVSFMKEKEEEFNKIIQSYVQKNSRNSTLLKAKHPHQS